MMKMFILIQKGCGKIILQSSPYIFHTSLACRDDSAKVIYQEAIYPYLVLSLAANTHNERYGIWSILVSRPFEAADQQSQDQHVIWMLPFLTYDYAISVKTSFSIGMRVGKKVTNT